MDALLYQKTINKFCKEFKCRDCPATGACANTSREPEKMVELVEKWLAEHPPVTYASKMREVFPNAQPTKLGCIEFVTGIHADCRDSDYHCEVCWNREYGSLEGEK